MAEDNGSVNQQEKYKDKNAVIEKIRLTYG
jgi:hypothetical protein